MQRLVRKGINFLNSTDIYSEERRVLVALALLKADEPESNRLVQAARKDCLDWCISEEMIEGRLSSIYQIAVVGLFLCELDPTLYRPQIKLLIKELEKRQKVFGGWGYPEGRPDWPTGDTSMTQYAILFAWTAKATGAAKMSDEKIRNATNWLLRTQDPLGGWGYQGEDPGSFRRVEQEEVRHSLAAAGVGSLYICSGMLGFTNDQLNQKAVDDNGLPPALELIVTQVPTVEGRKPDEVLSEPILKTAIRDGDKWFYKNYIINPPEYTAYYLSLIHI